MCIYIYKYIISIYILYIFRKTHQPPCVFDKDEPWKNLRLHKLQGTRICCQGGGSPNNSRISGAKICRLKPRIRVTDLQIGRQVGFRWSEGVWLVVFLNALFCLKKVGGWEALKGLKCRPKICMYKKHTYVTYLSIIYIYLYTHYIHHI